MAARCGGKACVSLLVINFLVIYSYTYLQSSFFTGDNLISIAKTLVVLQTKQINYSKQNKHGVNLYTFQQFEWLDMTNQTANIECNKRDPYHRCCSRLTDNKYLVGTHNNIYYNFTENDKTICDLLLTISNKSILTVGDSLTEGIFYYFIGDVLEQSIYHCDRGNITDITIDYLTDGLKNVSTIDPLHTSKRYVYHLSFDYRSQKHAFKWEFKNMRKLYPSSNTFNNTPYQINEMHHKFNFNKKSIEYPKLDTNLTNWKSDQNSNNSFNNFMNMIETGEYDSVLINLGAHYNMQYGSNAYKYILNFIANVLQNNMLNKNTIHIWRMTTPHHFVTNWMERLNYNHCLANINVTHLSAANSYEYEIFLNSNYSIPILDYSNILLTRGDLHLDEKHDCLHWCASNRLWKPFWRLLTTIYHDNGWGFV